MGFSILSVYVITLEPKLTPLFKYHFAQNSFVIMAALNF